MFDKNVCSTFAYLCYAFAMYASIMPIDCSGFETAKEIQIIQIIKKNLLNLRPVRGFLDFIVVKHSDFKEIFKVFTRNVC